ncbi:myomegalin isoform X13 [Betta splendens]|uniref:Myomegalin isoform X13 n=1 Tax=Betta splendens TaxID=158456 RepID=A0A6P7M9H3_BETSP|nr:myomegalin isoform X13 [Betta splendens]
MLDGVRMKEACRICARELCGNQRRWIFHAGAKLNLQVLLAHALGRELSRDGRGEFACSKCAFMLERMYRFDTVIARVEALSLERLHKLLLEKERLRQCIGGLYRKNNAEDGNVAPPRPAAAAAAAAPEGGSPVLDLSELQDMKYSEMVQEDLTYSVYESWADKEERAPDPDPDPEHEHGHHCARGESLSGQKPRRCRGCAALRVADSDYEAVCRVPRRVGRRSTSCGPSTRYSVTTEDPSRTSGAFEPPSEGPDREQPRTSPSPASSVESLDTAVDVSANLREREEAQAEKTAEEPLSRRDPPWGVSGFHVMLSLLRDWDYQPVKPQKGSKLPVLLKARLEQSPLLPLRSPCGGAADCDLCPIRCLPEVVTPCQQQLQAELAQMEEQWLDDYVPCRPFRFQQRLIDEQREQSQYESAAGQCVGELHRAQDQVRSLQAKIKESEARNQKLQERLCDMELELRSAREEAQRQERNILLLSDTVGSKEAEAAELYRRIEEQNKMLCSLKELTNRSQASGADAVQAQGDAVALQASLFQAQLELQAGQQAQRRAARRQDDLSRALQRLDQDLQGALQHRRQTEAHNQELLLALEKARAALQEREEQLRAGEHRKQRETEEREKTIRELQTRLETKAQQLEHCFELLDHPKEAKDPLVQKLRQRIAERDRALEQAVDEKFRCVEEKEEETRRLQLLLREKERDLERQRCVLANNEETITSLDTLLRGKTLELEQVSDGWRSVQRQQQDSEQRHRCILGERDAIIGQLQAALQCRTQEAQDLRSSLLGQNRSAPSKSLEELKVRLQLKDRLFQEVLADRTRQAQIHQEQVQDLLGTISARDQYIQDSAGWLSEVVTEQASRLQELRRQLSSGLGWRTDSGQEIAAELESVQEELRLALRREKEKQELCLSQTAQLDSLSRTLQVKEEIIRDFQRQMVDPSDLPLLERLTQEIEDLRESLVQRGGPPARGPVLGLDRPHSRQPEFGELSSEDEGEADDDDDLHSEESVEEEVLHAALFEGQGLMEVKQLVEQKRVVERKLAELKAQLEKAGFSSLSQMRKALFSLEAENQDLKCRLNEATQPHDEQKEQEDEEADEEELDVTIEGEEEEEEESSELWDAWDEELSLPLQLLSAQVEVTGSALRRPLCSRSHLTCVLSCLQQQDAAAAAAREKTVRLQLESEELKERLMVSEATVQAQAAQLKDYRELLTETAVQRDSKLVQVDLQDLGYETCGRSETEAEREEASSPEFDDLEMCTSLDCGTQWWPSSSPRQSSCRGDQPPSLQRLVEDLRSQLSRSQAVIRGLQSRLRTLSTSSKVNWASPSQSGAEEDEGWQSSDGGPHPDRGLQELASRVGALEDQLRKEGVGWDGSSSTRTGKLDALIQAQARELSHLRQQMREGRGACSILTQHLGDTTKAFEELLRANDIDYYMGQSFREQLAQGGALAQRLRAKISGREQPEDPEERTELLAIRLSKELQQKDKVIESLRTKLNHHQHHPHRSDTPCSGHALSDATDQSDRISYLSDEHGSTNEDLELCSDVDAASELGQEEPRPSARVSTDCCSHSSSMSPHASVPPSTASSLRTQSCLSCPSMQCPSSAHSPADVRTAPAPAPVLSSVPFPPPSSPVRPHPAGPRALPRGAGGPCFSLAAVQQELQMLQRQLGLSDRFSTPQPRALQGFPFSQQQPDSCALLPPSYHGYRPSPFSGAASSSSLGADLAMKAGASLLESTALWDMTYGARAVRLGADLSSGSSGYQSGTGHTGSELMKEHLREIRSLRQRLEDSIQTNDRLRQQLEEKLARIAADKGAPTNIYIQGLDSVGQLSTEIRLLKEENCVLQKQLELAAGDSTQELEQLREAALLERARLQQAELEAERWAERGRKLQAEAEAHGRELSQLNQDRRRKQDAINRLQHRASVLQQQLSQSRAAVHGLQRQLRSAQLGAGARPEPGSAALDPEELHTQLEKQLDGPTDTRPPGRRQRFSDTVPSPPVRDTGTVSPLHWEKTDGAPVPLGPDPHGSLSSHMVAHIQHFKALQQQVVEGGALLLKMEATLHSLSASPRQPSDSSSARKLLADAKTLRQIQEEADSLLQMFWRAAMPDSEEAKQNQALRDQVVSLRRRLSEQEQALKDATERLRSSDRCRDSMEHFIASQLSRTRDVLRKAKSNLQENQLRISSLHQASCSLSFPSSSPC